MMEQKILNVSLKQFLKQGIREMSIQKLVESMGISTKTVYKYFKNKEDLLEQALYLHFEQQYQMLNGITTKQNAACLLLDLWHMALVNEEGVSNTFFRDLHYYYPKLGKKVENEIDQKFKQQFLLIIHRGIAEGTFRNSIVPEVAMESIFVLYTAIVRQERFNVFQLKPEDVLLNTIALTIRGLCTVEGIKILDAHVKSDDCNLTRYENTP
jgi:AcrR family transcriptional regulator